MHAASPACNPPPSDQENQPIIDIDIVPIARTKVDWDTFLPSAQLALGRSISASIDAAGWGCIDLASFIAASAEFAKPGSAPAKALRSDGLALRHAAMSFLVAAPQHCLFTIGALGLSVSRAAAGDFAIVSGTLAQWQRGAVDGLKLGCDPELKMLLCLVVSWFERQDLSGLFGEHQKIHTADGLYYLAPKELR